MEKYQDKILLCLALLVLGGAIAFTVWQKSHATDSKGKSAAVAAQKAYQPMAPKPSDSNPKSASWEDPKPQHDPGETFEVATNPWIYVDKVSGAVSFVAPAAKVVRSIPDVALQFIGFRDDQFPLQIAGVSGSDQAIFYDEITGNTFAAGSGYDGPNVAHIGGSKADNPANLDLHLLISSVNVKLVPVADVPSDPAGTPITELVAYADVVNPDTGTMYHLSSQTRLLQGKPFARLKEVVGDNKGTVVSLKDGGSVVIPSYKFHDPSVGVIPPDWDTAPDTYTVSSVNPGPPPTVHLIRKSADLVRPELSDPGTETVELDLDLVKPNP